MAKDRSKSDIVQKLYGVNLEEQGRGYYVGLEFLAIARGVYQISPNDLLSQNSETISFQRISHDFARRVAVNGHLNEEELELAIDGDETLLTLHALTSSLLIQIPGRRKAPSWFNSHLYPFVGQLIHYDAVERKSSASGQSKRVPSIERYMFRGGGTWAYRVLRTDSNDERRTSTQEALIELVRDAGSPLGQLSDAMSSHDSAKPTGPFEDSKEKEIRVFEYASPWPEYLRSGVNNIVRRATVPQAKRIECLMHWLPYCLARHQLHLARNYLGRDTEVVFQDFMGNPNQLRRISQGALDEFRKDIVSAFNLRATHMRDEALMENNEKDGFAFARHIPSSATGSHSSRAFFSETLAAVGALNSTTGKRYFTMKPPMLEALVSATLKPGAEEEYFDYCTRLFEDMGILVDHKTAAAHHLTLDVDTNVYKRNSDAFHKRLAATGLLTQYSDATSIVHGEPR